MSAYPFGAQSAHSGHLPACGISSCIRERLLPLAVSEPPWQTCRPLGSRRWVRTRLDHRKEILILTAVSRSLQQRRACPRMPRLSGRLEANRRTRIMTVKSCALPASKGPEAASLKQVSACLRPLHTGVREAARVCAGVRRCARNLQPILQHLWLQN